MALGARDVTRKITKIGKFLAPVDGIDFAAVRTWHGVKLSREYMRLKAARDFKRSIAAAEGEKIPSVASSDHEL